MLVWRWLNHIPLDDPVQRKLAPILQLMLIAILVAAPIVFAVDAREGEDPSNVVGQGLFLSICLAALVLVRRGNFRVSAWILMLVLWAGNNDRLTDASPGDADEALLTFFLPLAIAGVLLGRRAILIMYVLTALAILSPANVEKLETVTVAVFMVNAALVTFLIDLLGNTLRNELKLAATRNRELEQARQELENAAVELYGLHERLRVTLTSIGDAVIATDVEGRITFINQVAEQITGWDTDEAVGLHLNEVFNIVNEESRQKVESPYDKVIRTGQIVGLANHTVLIRKDGTEVPIDDSGAPIRNRDGNIDGITLVFRDITERRQLEVETQEQHRVVDILLQTAQRMSSSFDYDEVAAYILDALQQVLPADFAYIALHSPVNIFKTRVTGNSDLSSYESTLKSLENPVEHLPGLQIMLNTRQPLLVSDAHQRDDWELPPGGESLRSFLGVPIFLDNEIIGFIGLRSREDNYFREAQIPRLQYFASQVAAGIHNARSRLQTQEVAITENRRELANELHDSVTQALFASTVVTKVLLDTGGDLPDGTKEHLTKLRRLNQGALAEMRTLLLELRQTDIATVDLPELMQQLATAAMGNSPANVEITIEGDAKLPNEVHVTFYRVAQEALNNITKHASAIQVELHLTLQPDRASLVIRDNGRGFDPHNIEASHFGLDIMRERAAAASADLKIESEIGVGTTISLEWNQAD